MAAAYVKTGGTPTCLEVTCHGMASFEGRITAAESNLISTYTCDRNDTIT